MEKPILKDYELNEALAFNKMIKTNGFSDLVEQLRDIAFSGICIKCGDVIGNNRNRCYCDRDD
jgi:hypothetical protein